MPANMRERTGPVLGVVLLACLLYFGAMQLSLFDRRDEELFFRPQAQRSRRAAADEGGRRDFEARSPPRRPFDFDVSPKDNSLLWHVQNKAELYRGLLMLSIVNKDTQESMVNMLLSMHRVGLPATAPLALCMDSESHTFLTSLGINSFFVHEEVWTEIGWATEKPKSVIVPANETNSTLISGAKQAHRKQVNRSKISFVCYLLKNGFNVLLLDNDIVMVRRNPNGIDAAIDYIHNYGTANTHIAISMDNPPGQPSEKYGHNYNTGFYLVRSTPETIEIFEEVVRSLREVNDTDQKVGDQKIFNNYFKNGPGTNDRKHERRQYVFELPWFLYMSGKLSSWKHPDKCCRNTSMHSWWESGWSLERDSELPYLLHFNFQFAENKTLAMQTWKVWHYADAELWKSAGFPMQYAPPAAAAAALPATDFQSSSSASSVSASPAISP